MKLLGGPSSASLMMGIDMPCFLIYVVLITYIWPHALIVSYMKSISV